MILPYHLIVLYVRLFEIPCCYKRFISAGFWIYVYIIWSTSFVRCGLGNRKCFPCTPICGPICFIFTLFIFISFRYGLYTNPYLFSICRSTIRRLFICSIIRGTYEPNPIAGIVLPGNSIMISFIFVPFPSRI